MKKIKIKTLYLIGIISIGLIGLGIGSTYAMFTTTAEINDPISMNTTLNYDSDTMEMIDIEMEGDSNKEIPLTITNNSNSTLNYLVWYMSDSSNIEVGTNLSKSDNSSTSGTISNNTTKTVYVRLKNNSSSNVVITLGVSSSKDSITISNNMTMVPNVKIVFDANFAKYITKLYTNASKTSVTNNSITYNKASSVSLMNDRLGSSGTYVNGGNVRYYGASPSNYMYFNCSNYSNQSASTCEKWRIIGVFDGKVKIMRNGSIGNYSWDTSASTTNDGYGMNNWASADAMKLLNSGYSGTGGSLYYNSGRGSCYNGQNNVTTTCNFTSTGIKNDTTKNLISSTLYNLGGWNASEIYSNEIYGYERGTNVYSGRPTTWTGKIALPYPSDYGYAADLGSCSQNLRNYNDSTCTSTNWMSSLLGTSNQGWLLTPNSTGYRTSWAVPSSKVVYHDYYTSTARGIFPTLYLLSNQRVNTENAGTSADPYQLIVQ